ncbi:hypothetical protein PybrP1_009372 [[Pythium] brassicae (nom. inval.)]|nr:hypothetical protein PybrP1_009372 [[Pythium] brassicae (nom. inval.)]
MSDVPIQIGPYRLGKTLGIGSFGKVKLAEHEVTGHKVAIKILNRSKIRSLDMSEKVRREISLLRKMRHPHIIRLYEVIDTPTDIFMVLEYVAGGELFDYIVSKGRDGDFLRTSCGSPNYAAPEVISGSLYAGPEVDVWSCGVILYALLCGSLPFDDESIPNLFKKIRGGMYSLPSHLSETARDLIPRMLVVDPMKRITIAEIRTREVVENQTFKIDEDVIVSCLALNFPTRVTREQLVALLHRRESHPLRVAYDLILDHKNAKSRIDELRNVKIVSSKPKTFAPSEPSTLLLPGRAPIPMAASPLVTPSTGDPRQFGGRNLPGGFPGFPGQQQRLNAPNGLGHSGFDESGTSPMALTGAAPGAPAAKRRRWYLGIQSKKEPAHVMSEVYKALHVLHFEWIVVAPYRVKCRWQPKGAPPPPRAPVGTGHADADYEAQVKYQQLQAQSRIKIGLQLYKVQQHIYLLDFQRLDGNAFTYMNMCARIITELKTLSGIRTIPSENGRFDVGGSSSSVHVHHASHIHQHPPNLH